VYFTLALWLFSSSGYEYVMARLLEGLAWAQRERYRYQVPRASSLARARERLGADALYLLFKRVAGPVGTPETRGAFWQNRPLVSWAGATLDVPDSSENDYTWGRALDQTMAHTSPCVRLFALAECGTQAVIDATFGPYHMEERQLARRLLRHIRAEMVLLADLRSGDLGLWTDAVDTGADLLWRIPPGHLPARHTLPDGTYLTYIDQGRPSTLGSTAIRVIDFTITNEYGELEPYSLATTLIDPDEAPRSELAQLYGARWDLQDAIGTFTFKPQGTARVKLRSTKPEGIAQEVWAMFCVYQAIRDFSAQALGPGAPAKSKISFSS
jgi:hypothetical protein